MFRNLLNPTIEKILTTFGLDKSYIRGEGAYLYDEAGNEYLDFIAQYGAIPFGYNPDFIWQAINEVRERMIPSLVQPSLPIVALDLANRLAEVTPGDLKYSTFCQSGTEAVEAAIKLARSYTGKEIIISASNSFHGKTLGALSATGKANYQKPFRAPSPGFVNVAFNDIEALQKVISDNKEKVAAFIIEPIQGEGGIIVAEPDYLQQVANLCRQEKVILIFDEVQTGLGRCGELFYCERYGIEPDILLLAKALGGGLLPLAVCLSSEKVWNDDYGNLHSSTFANNNLTCAAGIAVLDKLLSNERSFIKDVEKKGEYLLQGLRKIANRYPTVIKEIRGQGLMAGIEFHDLSDCGSFDMSFLINRGGFTALLCGYLLNVHRLRLAPFLNDSMTLRLEPPLIITIPEIDRMMSAIENICEILDTRNYAHLYHYVLGEYRRMPIEHDYRSFSKSVQASVTENGDEHSGKFGFILHYPSTDDIVANNPSFKKLSDEELKLFLEWQSQVREAGLCCHMPAIRSKAGKVTEGWLIGVPFGAKQIMQLPRAEVVKVISEAVDLARDLGATVVGLGALTSVVTRGGRDVTGRGVAITSGNSFTTVMAMRALLLGAQKMKIDLESARGAVIGATGSIGRACSIILSQHLSSLRLFGNPERPRSSIRRLANLAAEIMNRANQFRKNGLNHALHEWFKKALTIGEERNGHSQYLNKVAAYEALNPEEWQELSREINLALPIEISLELDKYLPEHNLIVTASNSPDYIVFSKHLSPGTVICDVARPADISPDVVVSRDDILVIEGGLVQFPDEKVSFGPNFGYRSGVSLACLAETVLLALEDERNDYSIGLDLPLDTIDFFQDLSAKHGFDLAGLMTANKEITDEMAEHILANARSKALSRAN